MNEAFEISAELCEMFEKGWHSHTTFVVLSKDDPLWREAVLKDEESSSEDVARAVMPDQSIRGKIDKIVTFRVERKQ